ncbi:MAG: hypothetical protein M3N95_08620 [Actinomycetota bacterium]|nr:hypothetical protein [Actinomycetota bacterium]
MLRDPIAAVPRGVGGTSYPHGAHDRIVRTLTVLYTDEIEHRQGKASL